MLKKKKKKKMKTSGAEQNDKKFCKVEATFGFKNQMNDFVIRNQRLKFTLYILISELNWKILKIYIDMKNRKFRTRI